MKIVKPIDVTDDVLIDSSIPMPDVARGEIEWQPKEQRLSLSGVMDLINVDGFGLMIDAIMTSDYVFILDRKELPSTGLRHYLSKYAISGNLIASVEVTPKLGYSSSIPRCLSLSGATISVGWINLIDEQPESTATYEFELVDFAVSNLSQTGVRQITEMDGKIVGQERIVRSFRFDSGVFLCSTEPRDLTERRRIELYAEGVKISDFTPLLPSNFAAISGQLVITQRSSREVDGLFFINADYYDYSFKHLRTEVVEVYSPTSDRPVVTSISTNSDLLTILSRGEGDYQFARTQLVDLNMINIGSYKRNDEVIKSSTKRKYRCAVDATFDNPELGVNLSTPTWVDIGAVNRWAPFDKQPSQQAVSDNPMYYKLKPGEFVRALSIFNISSVNSANIKVTDPVDGVIYDRDFDLVDNSNAVDMWTYLTLPISFKKELIITDLVCFRESEIEITLTGENPAVGAIVTGNESPVGRCVKGTGVRSNQFSIRKENGFGGFDIIQRGVGKIARFRVAYDMSQIDYITNLLESIDSQYCVFIGELPNNKVISIYGILDPYQSDFETPTVNTLEFDVLGVL